MSYWKHILIALLLVGSVQMLAAQNAPETDNNGTLDVFDLHNVCPPYF